MRYNVHVLADQCGLYPIDICEVEAASALEAVESGRNADLYDRVGKRNIIDTRDWVASEAADGSAMLAPKKEDDYWGGNLVVVADPIDESEDA